MGIAALGGRAVRLPRIGVVSRAVAGTMSSVKSLKAQVLRGG